MNKCFTMLSYILFGLWRPSIRPVVVANIICLIFFSSCSNYKWVIQEAKISTVGQKVHIEVIDKPKPVGDTTIRGFLVTKKRI